MKNSTEQLEDLAKRIVATIKDDMYGRRGFRQNWDAIDQEIQDDIVSAWRRKVLTELSR